MSDFQRNVNGQKWLVFAFDRTTNVPKTGDAANITAKIRKDYAAAAATNDTNPDEIEDGYYEFTLTQAESSATVMDILPESSTTNIQVIGVPGRAFTGPANHSLMGINGSGHLSRVTLVDTITVYTGNTAQTGDSFARIGVAGAGLTDLGGMSTGMKAEVNAEADTALADAGVTSARLGYVDNLNIGENVAGSSEVTSIQNNTRVVRVVPNNIELPDAGTRTYRVELLLYDTQGDMEAPDSAPTIALVNQSGTDRSSRLDSPTMALVSTGRYRAVYTSTAGDTKEQLVWAFSVVENGNTRIYGNSSNIVDAIATDFTTADRAKLDTLHDTRIPDVISLANINTEVDTALADYGANTVVPDAVGTAATLIAASEAAIIAEIDANEAKIDLIPTNPMLDTEDGSSFGMIPDMATATTQLLIKDVTDQFVFTIPGQVDANALTGGGGDDAATIYTYFTDGTNADAFKATVSGLATQTSVDAIPTNPMLDTEDGSSFGMIPDMATATNQVALAAGIAAVDDPWTIFLPGAYAAGTAGHILGTNLDSQVSLITSGGSGAISQTIIVQVNGLPVDGVEVWITTDAAGINVVAGTLTTDALGKVEFMLDAGTYYVWRQRAGYNLTNPQTITVS